MDYIPDYNDLYSAYEDEQERKINKLPKCSCCGEPIIDDYLYNLDGEILCEECLKENYRRPVEEYMED
jgi:formylmethanofuran dehydrogenase subunit E